MRDVSGLIDVCLVLVAASAKGLASSGLIQLPRSAAGNEPRTVVRQKEIVSYIFVAAVRQTKRHSQRCKRLWDDEFLTVGRYRPAAARGTGDKIQRGYREDLYRQS